MKRYKLNKELDFSFLLIGILCQNKDYRLCFELNKHLEINLQKQDDLEVFQNKKKDKILYSLFSYTNPDGDTFNLISNKSNQNILVPEFKQIDYLFQVWDHSSLTDEEALLSKIKSIPLILGAYLMKAGSLKSKENLVF